MSLSSIFCYVCVFGFSQIILACQYWSVLFCHKNLLVALHWWTKLALVWIDFQFLDKEHEDTDEDLDYRALENGFVS